MGWLTFNYQGTAKDYFTNMVNESKNLELVDIAIKNFRTAYVAVRVIDLDYTFCIVLLIHRAPKSYENFGYKDVEEFSGPTQRDCPERILKLLTPLEEIAKKRDGDVNSDVYQWAQNWRDKCQNTIDNAKELSKNLKKKIVKTAEPINFSSGAKFQYFKKEGRKWFAIVGFGTRNAYDVQVRLKGLKYMKFEFIDKK